MLFSCQEIFLNTENAHRKFIECTNSLVRGTHKKTGNEKNTLQTCQMLIIMHRLRTIFYYLPFLPFSSTLGHRIIAKCVVCASLQEKDTFSANDKSYRMYIMSFISSTLFSVFPSSSFAGKYCEKKWSFLVQLRELHNALRGGGFEGRAGDCKIYRPQRKRIKMQIHAVFSPWHLERHDGVMG